MSTLFKELLQMATYSPRWEVKSEMTLVPPKNIVPLNPRLPLCILYILYALSFLIVNWTKGRENT